MRPPLLPFRDEEAVGLLQALRHCVRCRDEVDCLFLLRPFAPSVALGDSSPVNGGARAHSVAQRQLPRKRESEGALVVGGFAEWL